MLDRVTEAVVENRPWLQKHLRIVAIGLARTAAIVVPHLQVAHLQRPCEQIHHPSQGRQGGQLEHKNVSTASGKTGTSKSTGVRKFEVTSNLNTNMTSAVRNNSTILGPSKIFSLAVMVMVLDLVTPSASNQTYSAKTSATGVAQHLAVNSLE